MSRDNDDSSVSARSQPSRVPRKGKHPPSPSLPLRKAVEPGVGSVTPVPGPVCSGTPWEAPGKKEPIPGVGGALRVSWGASSILSLPSGLWHAGQCFILASSICHEQDTPERPCFLTSGPGLTLGFIQNAHPVPTPHAHPMLSAASSRSTSMNTRRAPCPSTHPEGFCRSWWLLDHVCPTPPELPTDGKLLEVWWGRACPSSLPTPVWHPRSRGLALHLYSAGLEWGWGSGRWLSYLPPAGRRTGRGRGFP